MTSTTLAEVVLGVCVVVVVLALPIAFVVLRVRWLTRMGGSFECSLLLDRSAPGAGWAFGVARYVGEDLEWFRYYARFAGVTAGRSRGGGSRSGTVGVGRTVRRSSHR